MGAQAPDPRTDLKPGLWDAGQAISNLTLLSATRPSAGFYDSTQVGSFRYANSDLAFKGNYVFQGNFYGIQVWDIANPAAPKLRLAYPCAGGQGDPTVYGNLHFMSVEMPDGRIDCDNQGVTDSVSAERFRGVRIFDISDMDNWKQVAAVQTCRGSHTHTLVTDAKDPEHVYIYNSGTSYDRSPSELAGRSGLAGIGPPVKTVTTLPITSPSVTSCGSIIAGKWVTHPHKPATTVTRNRNWTMASFMVTGNYTKFRETLAALPD